MAWTVDDGASTRALGNYIHLLETHPNLRMTFFVLSGASSWKTYAKHLTALAATGQVQLGNHTHHHYDLTRLSSAQIHRELRDCQHFIEDNFNTSPGPYFRPPYGYIDQRVINAAKEIGYTKPTLWLGSTGAGSVKSSATDWELCQKWMTNGRIVIDHANSQVTVNNFSKILTLLQSRGLKTVTLNDAFHTGT
jgi:peptidoglycan/xylan/chitin deacetylase (PgdA/CDA1 family)